MSKGNEKSGGARHSSLAQMILRDSLRMDIESVSGMVGCVYWGLLHL